MAVLVNVFVVMSIANTSTITDTGILAKSARPAKR